MDFSFHEKSLPELADICAVINYCGDKLTKCDFSLITPSNHEKIMRYLMILGTISNSKRGGEVSRLRLHKVRQGLDGEWMPPQRVLQKLDADEKSVINDYMHFLVAAKKAGTEVDIVLHKDFRAAFEFLVNPDNRKKLGISPTNPFLFTNKRCNRSLPFYSRFEEVCKEAGLSEKLKAPDVRD